MTKSKKDKREHTKDPSLGSFLCNITQCEVSDVHSEDHTDRGQQKYFIIRITEVVKCCPKYRHCETRNQIWNRWYVSSIYIGELKLGLEEFGHVRVERMHACITKRIDYHEEQQWSRKSLDILVKVALLTARFWFLLSILVFCVVNTLISLLLALFRLDFRICFTVNHWLMDLCKYEAANCAENANCESNPKVCYKRPVRDRFFILRLVIRSRCLIEHWSNIVICSSNNFDQK